MIWAGNFQSGGDHPHTPEMLAFSQASSSVPVSSDLWNIWLGLAAILCVHLRIRLGLSSEPDALDGLMPPNSLTMPVVVMVMFVKALLQVDSIKFMAWPESACGVKMEPS